MDMREVRDRSLNVESHCIAKAAHGGEICQHSTGAVLVSKLGPCYKNAGGAAAPIMSVQCNLPIKVVGNIVVWQWIESFSGFLGDARHMSMNPNRVFLHSQ